MRGGRINTDFIDNSAGVDSSDHEVNIKILLDGEVDAGRLTTAERDALLASMTDEVAELVLRTTTTRTSRSPTRAPVRADGRTCTRTGWSGCRTRGCSTARSSSCRRPRPWRSGGPATRA